MPRFLFRYRDAGVEMRDPEAASLPDAEAAWFHAVRSARDFIDGELKIGPECWVEIADDRGRTLDAMSLREVVDFAG